MWGETLRGFTGCESRNPTYQRLIRYLIIFMHGSAVLATQYLLKEKLWFTNRKTTPVNGSSPNEVHGPSLSRLRTVIIRAAPSRYRRDKTGKLCSSVTDTYPTRVQLGTIQIRPF